MKKLLLSLMIVPMVAVSQYPGETGCLSGNCENGYGIYIFEEGELRGHKYLGEWKNGKFHGEGTYTTTEIGQGDTYVGEWKDGKRHGKGTYIYTKSQLGIIDVGEWKDDKFHGKGTRIYADGVSIGLWENGVWIKGYTF